MCFTGTGTSGHERCPRGTLSIKSLWCCWPWHWAIAQSNVAIYVTKISIYISLVQYYRPVSFDYCIALDCMKVHAQMWYWFIILLYIYLHMCIFHHLTICATKCLANIYVFTVYSHVRNCSTQLACTLLLCCYRSRGLFNGEHHWMFCAASDIHPHRGAKYQLSLLVSGSMQGQWNVCECVCVCVCVKKMADC